MNKKETIRHVLKKLSAYNRPLNLTEAFSMLSPGGLSMDNFRDLMDELTDNKWVIKKVEQGSSYEVLGSRLNTREISYTISIEGIRYVSRLNPFTSVSHWIKEHTTISISIASLAGLSTILVFFKDLGSDKKNIPATNAQSPDTADMDFSNDNFESGLLYAIKKLSTYDLPNWATNKVEVLKSDAKWVKEYLERKDIFKAKKAAERILPGFFMISGKTGPS